MLAHGLEVIARVSVRDHRLDPAHLRGNRPDSFPAADGGRAELLVVHDQQAGLVWKRTDDRVGAVDDQSFADVAQAS